jgi:DNA polymerase-1
MTKLLGFKPKPGSVAKDTMVIARTMFPSIKFTDDALIQSGKLPGKLRGKHSIKAWGYRLGEEKGDYAEVMEAKARELGRTTPKEIADFVWGEFCVEMFDYMMQDVATNFALWKHLNPEAYPQAPLDLEHRIAVVCDKIEEAGVPFDERAAGELQAVLVGKKAALEQRLKESFGSWEAPISPDPAKAWFVPKRDNAKLGYKAGVGFTKMKTIVFNPKSRDHIAKVLIDQGWKPTKFTEGGKPQIDEETVESIVQRYPAMEGLGEYMMLEKRLSQLCGTDNSLLMSVKEDGRIHGVINPGGTNTGRCSHFLPNLAQVPSAKKPYGIDFRRLFYAPPGWSFLGADMQGLELRGLAHFLHPLDGGVYAKTVLEGDPHWATVRALGLATGDRDKHNQLHTIIREDIAKTFAYAVIYGAGDKKAGEIVYEGLLNAQRTCGDEGDALYKEFFGVGIPGDRRIRMVGQRIRQNFSNGIEGFGALQARIAKQVARKNRVPGLDGRLIPVKNESAALNYLIQGAGAVLCKRWLADAFDELSSKYRYGWDGDFVFVLFIHDEVQLCVRQGLEKEIGDIVVRCAQEAGAPYGFRLRLDSEYSFGATWADTH